MNQDATKNVATDAPQKGAQSTDDLDAMLAAARPGGQAAVAAAANAPGGAAQRCGLIAIVGKPNVGKSTLLNALLGQKIAAVSPRPQTTRKRQLGILTLKNAQLIFVDTPGLHSAKHNLGEFLNQEAQEALDGVDLILWLVDVSTPPTEEDINIGNMLKGAARRTPRFLPSLRRGR